MKHLKRFKIFEADAEIKSLPEDPQIDKDTQLTNSQALDDSQKALKEFQEKRTKMEGIFKDPKITDDSLLDSTLLTQIYNSKKEVKLRNKWLVQFESILRMERRKNSYQDAINKDLDQVKKTSDDLSRLDSEVNNASSKRKEQIVAMADKNRKRLKELKDNIDSNKRLLSQDIVNWKKKHEDFKKDIKVEEDRIKNLLSKI